MKRTFFMHIPKTAGTSVLVYLRQVYAAHPRLELRNQDRSLESATADSVANAVNIWLHEPLYQLPGDVSGFFRFTFLRDPIERVGSLYAYLRDPRVIEKQDFRYVQEDIVKSLREINRMSFKDYIFSDDPIHFNSIVGVYPAYFASERPQAFATQQDYLEHCLKRMDHCFDLIGDTSHLSEDMNLIRKHCFPKYKLAFTQKRINESNKQEVDLRLGSDMEERLESMLALDLALFRQARLLRLKKREALESGLPSLSAFSKFRRLVRQPFMKRSTTSHGGAAVS